MSSNITNSSEEAELVPWLYQIAVDDSNWIITSSFMIFSMQTGFGMLESGCVSIKNEANIMMKNVVDIVLGGLTYWIFGYSLSFGRSKWSNPFICFGDYFLDPAIDDPKMGAMYAAFIFQLSFATTATTIVSGAMAERCNFKAYCIFSFLNTIIYCIPAGWVWGDFGFLKALGAVDIAGSGPVHLIGGSAAMGAAMMLGPRMGRYDNGIDPLPLGNPVNAVMGLFVLWWGWLAFNSGSTYGLSGEKWQYAARAAVMTMIASFGGGTVSLFYTMIMEKGKIEVVTIINGILGSLVAITAGCFLYQAWEALVIGGIGALLVCIAMPIFDRLGIDDPVGASAVHGIGGVWGVLAVGIFASEPVPLDTTGGLKGLIHGGGWYLLGIQALCCVCLGLWGSFSCMILLYFINKICTIRMELHHELVGADLAEHFIKHGQVGVSRALSALRMNLDTKAMDAVVGIGLNPGHDTNLKVIKGMSLKKRYKFSTIFRDVTKNRNFGINSAHELYPHANEIRRSVPRANTSDTVPGATKNNTKNVAPVQTISINLNRRESQLPPPIPWLD